MSTREVTSKHTNLFLTVAEGQVTAPPEATLYLSSTSTLAQCYFNFEVLPASVTLLTIFFVVNQDVMRN